MILLVAVIVGAENNAEMAIANDAAIRQQMESIVIRAIEFRNASGPDVLSFLTETANSNDPSSDFNPCFGGVIDTNKVLYTKRTIWTDQDGVEVELSTLTLDYRRITLLEAIEEITKALGLTYSFEDGELVFFRNGEKLTKKEVVEPLSEGNQAHRTP